MFGRSKQRTVHAVRGVPVKEYMKWTKEAEDAVSRVPFFVRKRVKKRVEEEAVKQESRHVNIEHVQTCQKRYLNNMEEDVAGFQVETCFGPSGCPNRAVTMKELLRESKSCSLGKI